MGEAGLTGKDDDHSVPAAPVALVQTSVPSLQVLYLQRPLAAAEPCSVLSLSSTRPVSEAGEDQVPPPAGAPVAPPLEEDGGSAAAAAAGEQQRPACSHPVLMTCPHRKRPPNT